MVSAKRKRSEPSDSDTDLSDFSIEDARSEDEMDISSALTGKRTKLSSKADALEYGDDGEDDDDDLQDFIRESIAKRDVKEGTELLKKTKGRAKIVKGEVGGGSFQSMGTPLR